MSDTVIRVENLSKRYVIGHQRQERYVALRDVIADKVKSFGDLFSRNGKVEDPTHEDFWALKDVSFEIKQGDRVGIIGRNGAGKSTLLKILSRITEPTSGRVSIKGRVASLLEVGTGFHPELTGRENIFLNGAILGMGRAEIKKKFDEIVDFAEVEKFLDTPVKHYSSGMYVRLAFAVAAHLEPEILIVDEVLAVGDAAFQKKCLGKMEDVAEKEGRTILFVSHNMAAIHNLCKQGILLNHGVISIQDKMELVVKTYIQKNQDKSSILLEDRKDRQGTNNIKFVAIDFENESREKISTFYSGQNVRLILHFKNNLNQDLKNFHVAIGIDNYLGDRITLISSEVINEDFSHLPASIDNIEIDIERLPLTQGRYGFTIYSTINNVVADWIQNAGFFDVESQDFYGSGKLPPTGQGNFLLNYHFTAPSFLKS